MGREVGTKYREWIVAHYPDYRAAYGQCAEATLAMVAAFPELSRVSGHYDCAVWGEREHWWCVDPDGAVVDPTAAQFPSKGCGEYRPLAENAPEPTRMCPECGGYIYDNRDLCSPQCERRYTAYLNGGAM